MILREKLRSMTFRKSYVELRKEKQQAYITFKYKNLNTAIKVLKYIHSTLIKRDLPSAGFSEGSSTTYFINFNIASTYSKGSVIVALRVVQKYIIQPSSTLNI